MTHIRLPIWQWTFGRSTSDSIKFGCINPIQMYSYDVAATITLCGNEIIMENVLSDRQIQIQFLPFAHFKWILCVYCVSIFQSRVNPVFGISFFVTVTVTVAAVVCTLLSLCVCVFYKCFK